MSTSAPTPAPDSETSDQTRRSALYTSSTDALKAVRDDFLYWTGKLTDSSFELCMALIAGNWAAFGSVQKILSSFWAKSSLGLVIATLAISLLGSKVMGELHRRRIDYAGADLQRWEAECAAALGRISPWPFTKQIERVGRCLREIRTWVPLIAGVCFFVALFTA